MKEISHEEFLRLLTERGIELRAREDRLQISAPAGALDADLRSELTRRKWELLDRLQDAGTSSLGDKADADRPVRRDREVKIPQTDAQQRMWLIDHFSPGNVAYNIPQAFLVEAPVDRAVLQKAVDALLARHETLRTWLYEEDGELLQAVAPEISAPVEFSDLSVLPEGEQDSELHRQVREQARRPFELDKPPLVRFHLFRLAELRHLIFFNIHHIIADRRSLVLMRDELRELYRAAFLNQPAVLNDLPVQYADYAIGTARRLSSDALDGQIQYWKAKLAGVPPFLELPWGRPYPEECSVWGTTEPVRIPQSLRSVLVAFARSENATLFMVLLASFAAFLFKLSGQRDFCVGAPFTHRNQMETEPIIGLFFNMLALRCQIDEKQSFRALVRQLRTTALEAYENSDVPFQELVRVLKPDLRMQRSPLFQVMFNFDPDDRPAPEGMLQIDTDPGTAKFDLTLELDARPEGIIGSFEYRTDLFEASQMRQWSCQFTDLLEQAVRNPDGPLRELDLLPEEETPLVLPPPNEPDRQTGWRAGLTRISQRFSGSPEKD